MDARKEIKGLVEKAVKELYGLDFSVQVLRPKDRSHGDYAVSTAMEIDVDRNSYDVALEIKEAVAGDIFSKTEVVEPGFINFFLSPALLKKELLKEKFDALDMGKGKKVQIEFVSANPTGPLTVGNARGGPFGDVLGNVFRKAGFKVEKAYYVNDYGKQILSLGHSILKDSENGYSGRYIDDLGARIKETDPYVVGQKGAGIILEEMIKKTLENLGIEYDEWFFESELYEKGEVDKTIDLLRKKSLVYEKDGATWFTTTAFRDERDRVLIKSDKEKTYLSGDIAYHRYKFEKKKFDKVINVWGADHYGDVLGLKAGAEALGYKDRLDIVLLQFVTVVKEGKPVKMSKRLGTAITMDDLLEELSPDAIRFFFLAKAANTHLNFDMDLAKEQSEKNPVYYVQYAYARICSILKKAGKVKKANNFDSLTHEREIELMKQIFKFREVIEDTVIDYQLQRVPQYAIDLATSFHGFYQDCQVLTEDENLKNQRLGLVSLTKDALKSVLDLMGVSAPEEM
ncbi:MAG: arginine--tRNA ligase [Candidatus Paceibacterota bacterium]|jgi:arginyl-tRNA synthetase